MVPHHSAKLKESVWIQTSFPGAAPAAPAPKGSSKGGKGNKGKGGKVHKLDLEHYIAEDFRQESWPSFLFEGAPQTIGKLNAMAQSKLKAALKKADNQDKVEKRTGQLAGQYGQPLERIFPNGMGQMDHGWETLQEVIKACSAVDHNANWNRQGLLGSLKIFFLRLKCLQSLPAD